MGGCDTIVLVTDDLQKQEVAMENPTRYKDAATPGLDIVLILLEDRWRIFLVCCAAGLLGLWIAFSLKPTFMATAALLPPQQQQSSLSAMLGQVGALSGLGGSGGLLKTPADTYVAMITSRTIADRLINRFHLQSLYKTSKMDDTRKRLEGQISAESGKDGLIHISVTDGDPQRASDITNALIDELYHLTSTLAITEAAQRRLFYDQQVEEAKASLATAEEDLKKTQEKTGLIQLNGQAEEIIRNVANLRAQIVNRKVQMQAMRTYATAQNPDVALLQEQINGFQQQLASMESNQRQMLPGDIEVPTGKVPGAGLEYARKLREVTYHTTLLNLLTQQYEGARMDEAKSAPLIQVVDRAVPPDRKSGPPRMLITLSAGIIGFCIACLWTFLRHALTRRRQNPHLAAKLEQVSAILHLRL